MFIPKTMKQITFKQAKKNHFYAEQNEKNQLELVKEPQVGKKYFEVPVISGGSK